ncbi:MAG: aminotransferase class I/II-fold pyridoxal phosphate-dependent enzyme [Candidatus Helarchaeota archaeon]
MKRIRSRKLSEIGESIFSIMTKMAGEYKAINLSQGFPDFPGPDFIKEEACKAIMENRNQYVPSIGVPELREAISRKYKKFYRLEYNSETEITVFSGATEAIYSTLSSILDPGDEVILFEPCYDAYSPVCEFNYAVPRYVRLEYPEYRVEESRLKGVFSEKTKCVVINTPNNPTGRVFGKDELRMIGEMCEENDCLIITDEVYEHITYEREHIPIASIKNLRDRVITISSTAKTFSLTGWKIGFALSSPEITEAIRGIHQFVTFCTPGPFQYAMAKAMELGPEDEYFSKLKKDYNNRREILNKKLKEVGFKTIPTEGTYYIVADITPFGEKDDMKFCEFMTKEIGVAAIPMSAFYYQNDKVKNLIRLCFSKKIENLEEAGRRLEKLKDYVK